MTDYLDELNQLSSFQRDYAGPTQPSAGNGIDRIVFGTGKSRPQPTDVAYEIGSRSGFLSQPSPFNVGKAVGQKDAPYTPPGWPVRAQVNLLGGMDQFTTGVIGSPVGTGILGTPAATRGGTAQVGPFNVATTPVNFQNFATYAREAPLSLLTGMGGFRYQEYDGQVQGPDEADKDLLDHFIDGVNAVGDAIMAPLVAVTDAYRTWDARNRVGSLRDIAQHGATTAGLFALATSRFDPDSRFDWQGIQQAARRMGTDTTSMAAELWDVPPEIAKAILDDPAISDEALDKMAKGDGHGLAFSLSPTVNLLVEGTLMIAPLLVGAGEIRGGGFIVKGLGTAGRIATGTAARLPGLSALDAAAAARVTAGTARLTGLSQAARVTTLREMGVLGNAVRTAEALDAWTLQKAWRTIKVLEAANRYSLIAGTGIRFGEWAIKQAAVIGGNQAAIDMMDQWLWEQPLSTNPGLMLVDAFAVHPMRTGREVVAAVQHPLTTAGRAIETATHPGATLRAIGNELSGKIQLKDGSWVTPGESRRVVNVVGIGEVVLKPDDAARAARVHGTSLDLIQRQVLDQLDWDPGEVQRVFGENGTLTATDLKNGLYYLAQQVVREKMGEAGGYFHATGTPGERQMAFEESFGPQALKLLEDTMKGTSTEIVDGLRGEFWERALLIDGSELGVDGLIGPYSGPAAMRRFVDWLRMSKRYQSLQTESELVVPGLRKDINEAFVDSYREYLRTAYPDEGSLITAEDLNTLKTYVPAIINIRGGAVLKRAGERVPKFTRKKMEKLLDEAVRAERERRLLEADARIARPEAISPLDVGDVNAEAAALGMRADSLKVLRSVAAGERGAETPVPPDLAAILKRAFRMNEAEIKRDPARAWDNAQKWLDDAYARAVQRGTAMDTVDRIGRSFARHPTTERASAGDQLALDRIKHAMNQPLADDTVKDPVIVRNELARDAAIVEFVDRSQSWLDSKLVDMEVQQAGDVVYLVTPSFVRGDPLVYARMVEQARHQPGISSLDLAILSDDTLHPLEKMEAVQHAVDEGLKLNEVQRGFLERAPSLEDAFGAEIARAYGPEAEVSGQMVLKLTTDVANRMDELEGIRAQARGLGDIVQRTPGAELSDTMRGFYERAEGLGTIKVGVGRDAARVGIWRNIPISREGIRAVNRDIEVKNARSAIERQIATDDGIIAKIDAERARVNAAEGHTLSESDFTWAPKEGEVFMGDKPKARATARALELHEATGKAYGIVKVRDGRFDVYEGELNEVRPEAAVPPVEPSGAPQAAAAPEAPAPPAGAPPAPKRGRKANKYELPPNEEFLADPVGYYKREVDTARANVAQVEAGTIPEGLVGWDPDAMVTRPVTDIAEARQLVQRDLAAAEAHLWANTDILAQHWQTMSPNYTTGEPRALTPAAAAKREEFRLAFERDLAERAGYEPTTRGIPQLNEVAPRERAPGYVNPRGPGELRRGDRVSYKGREGLVTDFTTINPTGPESTTYALVDFGNGKPVRVKYRVQGEGGATTHEAGLKLVAEAEAPTGGGGAPAGTPIQYIRQGMPGSVAERLQRGVSDEVARANDADWNAARWNWLYPEVDNVRGPHIIGGKEYPRAGHANAISKPDWIPDDVAATLREAEATRLKAIEDSGEAQRVANLKRTANSSDAMKANTLKNKVQGPIYTAAEAAKREADQLIDDTLVDLIRDKNAPGPFDPGGRLDELQTQLAQSKELLAGATTANDRGTFQAMVDALQKVVDQYEQAKAKVPSPDPLLEQRATAAADHGQQLEAMAQEQDAAKVARDERVADYAANRAEPVTVAATGQLPQNDIPVALFDVMHKRPILKPELGATRTKPFEAEVAQARSDWLENRLDARKYVEMTPAQIVARWELEKGHEAKTLWLSQHIPRLDDTMRQEVLGSYADLAETAQGIADRLAGPAYATAQTDLAVLKGMFKAGDISYEPGVHHKYTATAGTLNATGDFVMVNGQTKRAAAAAVAKEAARLLERYRTNIEKQIEQGPQPWSQLPEPAAAARTVPFPDPVTGEPIPTRVVLVDADHVITSADEGFPLELQPRARGLRSSSDEQITQMATEGLDPKRAFQTGEGRIGMPVLTTEGDVLAGNGRMLATRVMDDKAFAAYREALPAELAKYGIDPAVAEGMNRPVLVRELIDVDRLRMRDLAWQLNENLPVADLIPAFARSLEPGLMAKFKITEGQSLHDAFSSAANDEFVTTAIQKLPTDARKVYMDNGKLSKPGEQLLSGAIVAKVLRADDRGLPTYDAAQRIVADMFESTDSDIGRIGAGFAEGAAPLSQLQALADAGVAGPEVNLLSTDLVMALDRIFRWRSQKGIALRDMADPSVIARETGTLLAGTEPLLTAAQENLVAVLTKTKSIREVSQFLRGFAEAGMPETGEMLFVTERPSGYVGLLNAGVERVNEARLARDSEATGLQPFASESPPFDTALTKPSLNDDGSVSPPVLESPPVPIDELGPEIAARMEGVDSPTVFLDSPEDLAAVSDWLSTTTGRVSMYSTDPAINRVWRAIFEEPDLETLKYDIRDAVDYYDSLDAGGRRGYFGTIREGVNDGTATPGEILLFEKLSGGFIRRNEEGIANGELVMPSTLKAPKVTLPPEVLAARLKLEAEAKGPSGNLIVPRQKAHIEPDELHRVTGPDVPAEVRLAGAEAVARSGEHTVLVDHNATIGNAARRAAGAPVVRGQLRTVLEFNAPNLARRAESLDNLRVQAEAHKAATAAELDRFNAEPPPEAGQIDSPFLDARLGELWRKHMSPADIDTLDPAAQAFLESPEPRSLGEIADALESLDRGVNPTLTPTEAAELREGLWRIADAEMNKAYAVRGSHRATRAAAAITRPSSDWDAEALAARAKLVEDALTEVIVNDPAAPPLAGFSGTQYVPVPPKTRAIGSGERLSPRLTLINKFAEDVFPGITDELGMGRMQTVAARVDQSRGFRLLDTVFGSRPEAELRVRAVSNWKNELTGRLADMTPDDVKEADAFLDAVMEAWRAEQESPKLVGFNIFRRVSLLGPHKLNQIADKVIAERYHGNVPDMVTEMGLHKGGFAGAWRIADNRLRMYLRESGLSPLQAADYLYGKIADRGEFAGRGATMLYQVVRFLGDLRWIGLEAIEAPIYALSMGGPRALVEGIRKTGAEPLAFGKMDQASAMRHYAHWMASSDMAQSASTRVRYLIRTLAARQTKPFTQAVLEMAREEPRLNQLIRSFGDTPEQWLQRLNRDWALAEARGKYVSTREAEGLYRPFLEHGTIDKVTYDQLVAGRRYTGLDALDAELDKVVGDPYATALYERLAVLNHQMFNDLAGTFFGQPDRSNIQRLINHPLLYWPISYQIKATKWLLGMMLDGTMNVDTGATIGGAFQQLYDEHRRRMNTDPDYANKVAAHGTLFFIAGMILPMTPTDVGVTLSPFTRYLVDPDYSRQGGIFGWGPFYTYQSLLPRLAREESSKGGSIYGTWPGEQLQRLLPTTIRLDPRLSPEQQAAVDARTAAKAQSQIDAETQRIAGQNPQEAPADQLPAFPRLGP